MKRGKAYLVFWEMILLLASVLVFRSFWLFLDGFQYMSSTRGLAISLIMGVLLCLGAFTALHKSPGR